MVRSFIIVALLVLASGDALADPPDPYAPEAGLTFGYGSLDEDSGASLGVHVGGFPVDVLYVGAHVDHLPLGNGGGTTAGVEVGARYVKYRSPRFTGFLSSGVVIRSATKALFMVGAGLRIDLLVGQRLLLGATVRFGLAPEPVTSGDSSRLVSTLGLGLNLGIAF